ncbi:LysE family translocator [Macrococcus capreoli]|uniref:LysE family translocator n=1 Tax=Macrococcus capreoli TaxID=2982690 RepID=UPI0021D56D94|nr:LysE family transporter [Macrococcus sp. TMW 2.2395]MCU7557483.1 LysE family transporter [Macrococcus sp. TMW 2.2395]
MHLLNLVVYAIIASFTPGPNNLMSLYFATQSGFKKTLRFVSGVGLGFLILLSISAFLNSTLASYFPKVELLMKIIGALYMLYLAYKMVAPAKKNAKSINNEWNNTKTGMFLQFVNPKGVLYSITIMGTFVTPYYHAFPIIFSLILLTTFIAFLGTLTWSIFGSVLKAWISEHERAFNITMALLLVYTAISIFFS